jgi:hypothetical protein
VRCRPPSNVSAGGVAENSRHDLGTDLFVLARDERLFDLGLVAGVQVKSGGNRSRYFRERVRDGNGELRGWWYRDDDRRHVDAWVSHALPHLIVLHNLDTRTSYWAHVTPETAVAAGQGAKVLVPKANTIDESAPRRPARRSGQHPARSDMGAQCVGRGCILGAAGSPAPRSRGTPPYRPSPERRVRACSTEPATRGARAGRRPPCGARAVGRLDRGRVPPQRGDRERPRRPRAR